MTRTNRSAARPGLPTAGRFARRGFTLIELLVVLAIMVVLASLIMAAVQKVRVSRMVRDSESTVVKCQSGVDYHVKAINDQVALDARNRTDDFRRLTAYCDGDEARAAALLTYCRIKQAFPQSAAEVANAAGFNLGGVSFPRSPAFASLQGITGTPDQVSAALLYAALANRTIQGTTFGSDDGLGGSQADINLGGSRRVYVDAWRTPIALRRWHQSGELDRAPYAPSGPLRNPFDPAGKLANWTPPNPAPNNRTNAENALWAGAPFPRFAFTSSNTSLVVYSAGNNGTYDNLTGDDILGYRLRAIGGRGTP